MEQIHVSSCFFLTPETCKRATGSVVMAGKSFVIYVYLSGQHIATVGTFANSASAIDDARRYGLALAYPTLAVAQPFHDTEDFTYLPPEHWRNQPPRVLDVDEAAALLPELGKALLRGIGRYINAIRGRV